MVREIFDRQVDLDISITDEESWLCCGTEKLFGVIMKNGIVI